MNQHTMNVTSIVLNMTPRTGTSLICAPRFMHAEFFVHKIRERMKDPVKAWRDTPVTSLMVGARTPDQLRTYAELVLG